MPISKRQPNISANKRRAKFSCKLSRLSRTAAKPVKERNAADAEVCNLIVIFFLKASKV